MTHRLLLAVNDAEVARRAAALADEGDDLEVVEVVLELERVVRALRRTEPDALVLHDQRGSVTAFELARELSSAFPEVGIVVIVGEVLPDVLRAGMQAGARDVVGLPLALEDLEASVRAASSFTRTMRERVTGDAEAAAAGTLAGRIVVVGGAKGGVGTTTVALHLALAAVAARPERPICLVDFDLRTGDLRSLLDVSLHRSIVDLVDVAGELSVRHLNETLHTHRSGLRLLLGPEEGEQAEEVTVEAARNVLGALRTRHDLLIVDVGAHVADLSAAAYELADRVLVVATPDVPALRGAQRLTTLLDRLQIGATDTRLVLNRTSRKVEVQPDLARRVVGVPLTEARIPADFSAFEPAINTGMPERLEDKRVREQLSALLDELDVLAEDEAAEEDVRARGGRTSLISRLAGDQGQSAAETMGILPVVIALCLAIWQIGLVGYTFFAAGHAAREGARALATGEDEPELVREDLPDAWRGGLRCSIGEDRVRVSLAVPVVMPGIDSPWRIASSAATTVEDAPVDGPSAKEQDRFKVEPAKEDACNDGEEKPKRKKDPGGGGGST